MSGERQQVQSRQRSGVYRSYDNRYDRQRSAAASGERGTRGRQSAAMPGERGMRGRQSAAMSGENIGQRRSASERAYPRSGSYAYQHGTAVRELSFEELLEEAPKKKPNHTARKNREKAVQMNLGYVTFLVGALALAAVVLIGYINLQSDITNSVKRVSRMESELHALRRDNDEYETRINSSVDLEEVKRIAICELGMKYASEGQIIRVEGGGDDYARKYAEIPQE